MMNKTIFLFMIILTVLAACKDKATENSDSSESPTYNVVNPDAGTPPPPTPPSNPQEPPQNASGVWHYTCPNGCAGGGGSATPCPKCGTTLAHNQAYHDGAANTTTNSGQGSFTTPPLGSVSSTQTNSNPPTQEPPQNAKGVWHFTCPNGCSGGGGSTTPCPKCGTTLVHNQAYHQ